MTNRYFQEIVSNILSNIEYASRYADCPVTDLLVSTHDTLDLLASIVAKEGVKAEK